MATEDLSGSAPGSLQQGFKKPPEPPPKPFSGNPMERAFARAKAEKDAALAQERKEFEEANKATSGKTQVEIDAQRKALQGQSTSIDRGKIREVETSVSTQFRETQANLIAALEAQSRGEGPSVAQGQLKIASDRALSQQLALAAQSRTPAQGALAQRLASRQAGEQQQALAGQSAALRLQEQLQAQQALAGVSAQARGQDIQVGGLQQQAGLANQGVDLQTALANQGAGFTQQQLLNDLLGIQSNLSTGVAANEQGAANLASQLAANQRAAQQQQASRREAGLFQAAGTAFGAVVGGPAGAAVGSEAGKAAQA